MRLMGQLLETCGRLGEAILFSALLICSSILYWVRVSPEVQSSLRLQLSGRTSSLNSKLPETSTVDFCTVLYLR